MTASERTIDRLDWASITGQLDLEGYALLPGLLAPEPVHDLAREITTSPAMHRLSLASMGLGRGELLYFGELLPEPLASWRTAFYRHLSPIANRWNMCLGVDYRYPAELDEFLCSNHNSGQVRAQSHLNRLGENDYLTLHQRADGEYVFPLQIVALLSQPVRGFEGGGFVMTEQRPRMQSRPMVLPLELGDAAIISTAQRPIKGIKGYYEVNLKHAISRVRHGERIGLEMFFHSAR